jgi:hypothetical protein
VRLGPTRNTYDAIVVDANGDGRLDIVTAENDGHTAVFRQTAPRVFADPDVVDVPGFYEEAVAAADLNEDGVLDFAASESYGEVALLLSGDGGVRTPTILPGPSQAFLHDIAIADFDGDHHLDIAVPVYDTGSLGLFWATGPGTFPARADQPLCIPHPGAAPDRLAVIDANEDQQPDLVVACNGGESWLLLNARGDAGARRFTLSPLSAASISAEALATGDVNHDGHVDIVLPDNTLKRVVVLLGDGHGNFAQPTGTIATTQAAPVSAALGDFDHDGKVDLVLGLTDDPHFFFYAGTGDGHFQPGQSMATPWTAIKIHAGDVDGDGFDDVVVTNWGEGATVYFGPCP